MLDLFNGLLSLFLSQQSPKVEVLRSVNWSSWLNTVWVQSAVVQQPDSQAEAAVSQHLRGMAALNAPVNSQGIWIQSGNQVLAQHEGTQALPAASLTKIATTLAALTTWGPSHRFETLVSATGPIENGVLKGDLVVQGGSDPFFVWEEAIILGNALNQKGIRQVNGNLIITENFAMNFETDPSQAGGLLKQALDASLWSADTATQYQNLPSGTARPQVKINGTVQFQPASALKNRSKLLVRHQSLPMVDILKAMNIYSNNSMSEMLANSMGGAAEVVQRVRQVTQIPTAEIQLKNGSGLGIENRLSPRAITSMLVATQRYLQPRDLTLADIYPVMGRDGGTLKYRRLPPGSTVKTGTLNEVSSLAGVVPTRDRGLVWFAMINLGTGNLEDFHQQQDRLLQSLQQAWGTPSPLPPSIQPSRAANPERLGAAERNELI